MPVLGQPRATKPSWQPVKGTRDKGFKDCVLFAEVLIYSMSAARTVAAFYRCRKNLAAARDDKIREQASMGEVLTTPRCDAPWRCCRLRRR